jgi:hypothetical protein
MTHWGGERHRLNAIVATTQKLSPTIIEFVEITAHFSATIEQWLEADRNLVEKRRLDLSNPTLQH